MSARVRSGFAYCEGPLPLPPGTSPFHIKGEFYRQLAISIAHHDEKSGGALMPALAALGLRDFASQTFLSSALYDALPLPRIVMAIAQIRGWDVHELTTRIGHAVIQAQMKGVYGKLLAALTTNNFHQLFDRVIKQFYDFGPVTLEAEGSGARLVRSGTPLCIAEWWSLVTIPFAVVPLTATGAREVTVDWRIEPGGVIEGVDVGDVVWQVRWAKTA